MENYVIGNENEIILLHGEMVLFNSGKRLNIANDQILVIKLGRS